MALGDITRKGYTLRNDVQTAIDERPDMSVFVADKILPPLKQKDANGHIPVIKAGTGRDATGGDATVGITDRAPNGTFNRGDFSFGEDEYTTKVHGFGMGIELIESMLMEEIFDYEVISAEVAQNTLLLDREKRIADAVYNTTLFTGANYTLAPATKWDADASKAKADIKTGASKIFARRGIPQKFLSLTLDGDTIDAIINSLAGLDIIKYTTGIVEKSREEQIGILTRYLNVKEIIETESFIDLDVTEDAPSFGKIWDKTKAGLFYLSDNKGVWNKGLGRQPIWSKYSNDYRLDQYNLPETHRDIIEASDYRGQKVFKDYGFLFTAVV